MLSLRQKQIYIYAKVYNYVKSLSRVERIKKEQLVIAIKLITY